MFHDLARVLLLTIGWACVAASAVAAEPPRHVWDKLGTAVLSFRWHLTQEHVDRYSARHPWVATFWQTLYSRVEEAVQEQLDVEQLAEFWQQRYGFPLQELIPLCRGEWGVAAGVSKEMPVSLFTWITPEEDEDGALLYSKIKQVLAVEQELDPASYLVQETDFAGGRALLLGSVRPHKPQETEEQSEKERYRISHMILWWHEGTLYFCPYTTDRHITYPSKEEALRNIHIDPAQYRYLVRAVHEDHWGEWRRLLMSNPAVGLSDEPPLWELAIHVEGMLPIMHSIQNDMRQDFMRKAQEANNFLWYVAGVTDWLKLIGVDQLTSIYVSEQLTAEGDQIHGGVAANFGKTGHGSLLEVLFYDEEKGVALPGWLSNSIHEVNTARIRYQDVYSLLVQHLNQNATINENWQELLHRFVERSTGFSPQECLDALGRNVYVLRMKDASTEDEEDNHMARVIEVKHAQPVLEALKAFHFMERFEPVSMLGFHGWQSVAPEGITGIYRPTYLLANAQYVVDSSGEEFTVQLLNQLNRGESDGHLFMHHPLVRDVVEQIDLTQLSYLSIGLPTMLKRSGFDLVLDMQFGDLSVNQLMRRLYLEPIEEYARTQSVLQVETGKVADQDRGFVLQRRRLMGE